MPRGRVNELLGDQEAEGVTPEGEEGGGWWSAVDASQTGRPVQGRGQRSNS